MYCPTCGSEERQTGQFCRACGTDMRAVRLSLERPDAITASAVSAREEISRAVAEKIREMQSSRDLHRIAEDVLPNIEKFLESPEEKRLRRLRAGVITAASGIGVGSLALLLLMTNPSHDLIAFLVGGVGIGVVTFMIGLGLILNALLFTIPRKQLPHSSSEAEVQGALDYVQPSSRTMQQLNSASTLASPSVTEHTTRHLADNQ